MRDAGVDLLLQAGDADLEELVEVRAADRQEAQALEQRRRRVARLLEHAHIELQERQLAIEKGARRSRGRGGIRCDLWVVASYGLSHASTRRAPSGERFSVS